MKNTKLIIFCFLSILFSVYGQAQDVSIKGKVIDEKGLPIPGVSILIKGTSKATSSDFDGNYQLKADSNGTLVFSFVGYGSVQEPIKGRTQINVTMKPSAEELHEVVVTALGIKRETKALGYATQKVSGEALTKVSGVDVASSLTGKVSGLLVRNTPDFNGAPAISIRGESNVLLVIDGVPYANKTLSDISSEDIESITVLKGATSAALYGYKGANGAIMITTKNGTTNLAGLSVDYANNTMFSAGFLAIPEKQSVYGRGGSNLYDKNSDASWGAAMDGTVRNQWDPKLKAYADYPYVASGKDNFKNFVQQGYITNNNFNVGYKGDITTIRSSVNWVQNTGVYPNQKADRYTYALGGDINLDKFKLSSNVSYSKRVTPNQGSNSYTAYDPMYSLLIWSPTDFNLMDYKDNYWIKPNETQNYTLTNENNPYFDAYEKTNEVHRDIFNADLTMSYQLTDWLKASVRSGLDFYTDKGELRVSWGSITQTGNTGVPGNPYTWNGGGKGAYVIGQNQGNSINTDFLLTGDRSFDNNKFKVEYLAGGSLFKTTDDNIQAWTSGGLSVPGFFSLKASVSPAGVSTTTRAQQINSLYGRVAFSYDKWAYFEMTGRNDWNSTMVNSNAPSFFYPSASISIVVSELLPESTKSWLDLLKIRDSWTMTKNPAPIYGTTVNDAFGINSGTWNSLNGAVAPANLYNSDIFPESSTTYEVGMQAILFKNRLNFDLTYYDKHMYDFQINRTISPASGMNGTYTNSDTEISRRGWELTLGGAIVKTHDWQWDVNLNWSTFARYYTKLDVSTPKNAWTAVGKRVDVMYSRDYLRDPATGKQIYSNGIVQFNPYDTKFGYTDPDYIWGVNSTLRYKDFSFFASFDGVNGGLMNSRTESYMWQSGVHPDSVTPERALDVATPGSKNYLGDGVKVVSGTFTYDNYGNITSDTRVYAPNDIKSTYKAYATTVHNSSAWGGNGTPLDTYSKTFFKLRELSLTYTLPKKYIQGWAKAASVSFVGQNVFLKAKDFKYSDPDGSGYNAYGTGANATGTVEDFSDPALRYLGGNIKVTF